MNKWLFDLLSMVLSVMTPELRMGIESFVKRLDADAKKTPNPWDDIFVGVLKSILGMKD